MEIVLEPGNGWTRLTAISRREPDAFEAEKGLQTPITFDVHWLRDVNPDPIGAFTLAPMPGCCGVVVSTASYLRKDCGSKAFHKLKELVAKQLGYACMLATVETSNFPELIGAAKNGWKLHPAFTNKRTGHQLTVMEKKVS